MFSKPYINSPSPADGGAWFTLMSATSANTFFNSGSFPLAPHFCVIKKLEQLYYSKSKQYR